MNTKTTVEIDRARVTIKTLYGGHLQAFVFHANSEKGAQLLSDLIGSRPENQDIPNPKNEYWAFNYRSIAAALEFMSNRLSVVHREDKDTDYLISARAWVLTLRKLADAYERGTAPPAPISPPQLIAFETGNLISDIKNLQEVVKSLEGATHRRIDEHLARLARMEQKHHESREAFKTKLDKLADRVSELEQRDPKCLFDTLTEKIATLNSQRAGHDRLTSVMLQRIQDLERTAYAQPPAPDKLHDPERIDRVLAEHTAQLADLRNSQGTLHAFCAIVREKIKRYWGDIGL